MRRTLAEALEEIQHSERGPKIAAFFDFDGTLIYGYSALVFAQDRIMSRQVGASEALRTLRLGIDYARGKAGYDELIKLAGSTWKGRTPREVEQLGERLFKDHIFDKMYPEARALVAAHQHMGHTVAITTSATWFQVAPIAKALGIPDVVCQHLEVVDNLVTGQIAGASMWGAGKATAARKFADTHDVNFDASFFYADGDEDTALMSEIGNPRPTNPGKHLASVAEERGWPTLHFAPRGTPSLDVVARNLTSFAAAAPIATVAAISGLLRKSRQETTNLATRAIPDMMFALNAVDVEVTRSAPANENPTLYLWKQQSRLDAIIIAKVLRDNCVIVVDRSLATDPILGTLGRLMDIQFVRDTSDPDPRLRAKLTEILKSGRSVAIGLGDIGLGDLRFGDSSVDHSSRITAAHLRIAATAKVEVATIEVHNSGNLVTRHPPMIRPGTIHVEVHAPKRVDAQTREEFDAAAQIMSTARESW